MLVLSRTDGERIRIGEEIEIVVCSIRGDRVKIGISAPRGVSVVREELRSENETAHEHDGDQAGCVG